MLYVCPAGFIHIPPASNMRDTNRSLWFAVLACLAMGLFARSPRYAGGTTYAPAVFLVATIGLSLAGLWWGIRGARRQQTGWAWLAPGINAFILLIFIGFVWLLFRAIQGFQ
jgi:hypothetical protein